MSSLYLTVMSTIPPLDLPSSSPPVLDRSDTPLAYRVVRGGLVVAIASYATILIGFGATIIMARLVMPRDFGTLAIAAFLFGIINLRTKIGLGQAFVHHTEVTGRANGTLLTLDLGAGLVSLLLALAIAPFLHLFGYADQVAYVMIALALVGMIEAGGGTPGILLDKNLQFGRTTIVTAITLAASYIPAIYLAWQGWGVWSLVTQAVVQTCLTVLGFWWVARRTLTEPWRVRWTMDWGLAREYLRFGLVAGSAMIAGFFTSQFDNFLVGTFVGLTVLGLYDRAYRFASWPTLLVTNIVARTSFFTYAQLQNDRARLSKTLEMTLWIITTIALPLALVIFVTAPDLIAFLIGDQWVPAATFLRFLVVFSLLRPLQDDVGGLLLALGKPHLVSKAVWLETLVLMVVASILTYFFGAVGTATGVGIAFIIGCSILYYWAAREVDVDWGRALGVPLLISLLVFGSYYLVNLWMNWVSYPLVIRLALKVVYTAVLFFGLAIAIQPAAFVHRLQYVWGLARGATPAQQTS